MNSLCKGPNGGKYVIRVNLERKNKWFLLAGCAVKFETSVLDSQLRYIACLQSCHDESVLLMLCWY